MTVICDIILFFINNVLYKAYRQAIVITLQLLIIDTNYIKREIEKRKKKKEKETDYTKKREKENSTF